MSENNFYRLAGKQIKELVQPYGFKKSGRFFYRITEEGVVQQFCLLWSYRSFTVRFYLSSIYGPNGKHIEGAEIYELINGSTNQWVSDPPSGAVPTTDDFVLDAAVVCTQAVKNTLLPFFESHKDPLSARAFIISHNSRIACGLDQYDVRELGLLLNIGDISSAQGYLEYYIQNCDKFNKKWWNSVKQEYCSLLEAIMTDDKEFLSAYMDKKKNETYTEYKWKNSKRGCS